MTNLQLTSFIKAQKVLGRNKDQIKNILQHAGWIEKDINEAFIEIDSINNPAKILSSSEQKTEQVKQTVKNIQTTPTAFFSSPLNPPPKMPLTEAFKPDLNKEIHAIPEVRPQIIPEIKPEIVPEIRPKIFYPSIPSLSEKKIIPSFVSITPNTANIKISTPPAPPVMPKIEQIKKQESTIQNTPTQIEKPILKMPSPLYPPSPQLKTPPLTPPIQEKTIPEQKPQITFQKQISISPIYDKNLIIPKKSRFKTIIQIIFIIVIIAINVVSFLYFFKPSLFSFIKQNNENKKETKNEVKNENEILVKMLNALNNSKTFQYNGNILSSIKFSDTSVNKPQNNIVYVVSSIIQGTVNISQKNDFTFDHLFNITLAPQNNPDEKKIINLEFKDKVFNSNILQINDKNIVTNFNIIKNKLIKSDTSKIEEILTQQKIKEIKKYFIQLNVLGVEKVLNDEQIGNIDAYHYLLSINKENFKSFIYQTAKIIEVQLDTAKFEKEFNLSELPPIEIWIGKNDNLPYKISIQKGLDPAKNQNSYFLNFIFNNWNLGL